MTKFIQISILVLLLCLFVGTIWVQACEYDDFEMPSLDDTPLKKKPIQRKVQRNRYRKVGKRRRVQRRKQIKKKKTTPKQQQPNDAKKKRREIRKKYRKLFRQLRRKYQKDVRAAKREYRKLRRSLKTTAERVKAKKEFRAKLKSLRSKYIADHKKLVEEEKKEILATLPPEKAQKYEQYLKELQEKKRRRREEYRKIMKDYRKELKGKKGLERRRIKRKYRKLIKALRKKWRAEDEAARKARKAAKKRRFLGKYKFKGFIDPDAIGKIIQELRRAKLSVNLKNSNNTIVVEIAIDEKTGYFYIIRNKPANQQTPQEKEQEKSIIVDDQNANRQIADQTGSASKYTISLLAVIVPTLAFLLM